MNFADRMKVIRDAPLPWTDVPVILDGQVVGIRMQRLGGREWLQLADRHYPRDPVDQPYRYARDGLVRDYLPAHIEIMGASPTTSDWHDLLDDLDGYSYSKVRDTIHWINVGKYEATHAAYAAKPSRAI